MVSRVKRIFIVMVWAALLNAAFFPGNAQAEVSPAFLEEAQKLYEIEQDYFQKRHTNDWPGAYDYQHPEFKRNVTLEEFRFFDGWVVFNYRGPAAQHVSGGYLIPSMDYIKRNAGKKDMLGFPAVRKYQILSNPLIKVKSLSIQKISVSKDKKFARVLGTVFGRQKLNPAIVHGIVEFDVEILMIDYWEKADGRWVITLLKDTPHLSGSKHYHLTPNDDAGWAQMEFIDIDASLAAAKKQ